MTDPQSIAERMALAMRHQAEGRLAEAAALYEAIVAEDERQVNARHNLGMVRLATGRFAEGIALLEEALAQDEENPGWPASLPAIGMTLFRLGRWEQAAP